MQGGVGAQPPHRANGAERARRPKADKEGQDAEGSSEDASRLEDKRGQRDLVPMGPTGPNSSGGRSPRLEFGQKPEFGKVRGHKLSKLLVIRAENSSRHINSV